VKRQLAHSLGIRVALAISGLAGCDDDSVATEACVSPVEQQPRQRLTVGSAFYLSAPTPECEGSWEIAEAPSDNANAIVLGSDGYVRFTPHVAGTYSFAKNGDVVELLTVVNADTAPFHNVNYYGGASIAFGGDEVWTADVFAPTLTRLAAEDLAVKGSVDVGSWPVAIGWHERTNTVLVAQKGSDTVGVIDVASGHIVDSVWGGDEPANLVIAEQAGLAYVAVGGDGQVAVINIAARSVVSRIEVGPDPFGIAISPDESTLAVARRRSGHTQRFPYEDSAVEDQRDVVLVDAETGEVTRTLIDVGTTINGLTFTDDGAQLLVANTLNDTESDFADGDNFTHEIARYDVASGELVDSADLGLQESSAGYAVFVYSAMIDGDSLWVPAEGSDALVQLDATTMEETARFDAPGRPRAAIVKDGGVFVHGEQGFVVTRVEGEVTITGPTGDDPRPDALAAGQAFFTGTGETYAQSWGCQGCHTDGLTDRLIWRNGPFPEYEVPRPIFWTGGTEPLGWASYVSSPEAFALVGLVNIGRRTNREEADQLGVYLASLMPPPPATAQTVRDGQMSDEAVRGRELFEGRAGCIGCHGGPVGTNQAVMDPGITPGRTDVPSLVSIERFGIWLKDGSAITLETSVREALAFINNDELSDDEVLSVTQYLREWTAREFFLLDADPEQDDSAAPSDTPIKLTFSYPVWDTDQNLARISLIDASGAVMPASVSADARHVTSVADSPMDQGAAYNVVIAPEFESFNERSLGAEEIVEFEAAAAPTARLEGEYVLTFMVPNIDIENERPDPSQTVPTPLSVVATETPSGELLEVDLLLGLSQTVRAISDGDSVWVEPVSIPAGPFALGDSSGLVGTLIGEDGDGIAESITGATTIFSGPGFWEDISWTFARPIEQGPCDLGTTGPANVAVTRPDDGSVTIDWDGDVGALGLYVTDPGATLPTLPGTFVEDGMAYWVLETDNFPTGFSGPATYDEVPEFGTEAAENHGGEPGAAELVEGECYQFSVTRGDFQSGNIVLRW
jgi:DNA-binding beta-propeller fold protein YncE